MDNILGQEEEDKMLAQAERDPSLRYDQGPAPTQQQLQQSALELQQMHSRNDFQVLFNNGSQELEEKMPDGQNFRPTPQQSEAENQGAAYFARLQQQQLQHQRYQAQQAQAQQHQAQQHQAQYSHQPLPQQMQGHGPRSLPNDSQQQQHSQNSQHFPQMVQQTQQNGADAQLQRSPPLQYGAHHQQLLQQPVRLQQGQQFWPPQQLGPQPGYEQLLYGQHTSQHGLVSHPQPRQQPAVQAYDNDQYLERMNSAMISAGVPVHMPQAKESNATSSQQKVKAQQQAACRGLDQLPYEILVMIMQQLKPMDFINCRRVSKGVASKLRSNQLCREYLRDKFPLSKWGARWIRYLSQKDAEANAKRRVVTLSEDIRSEMAAEGVILHRQDWSKLLLDAIRRRLAIDTGTYCRKITYKADDCLQNGKLLYSPAIPWGLQGSSHFHDRYADPPWAFENGILVYFKPDKEQYVATMVGLGKKVFVPIKFPTKGRIIRRVRMSQGVLVFDWAELKSTFVPPGEHVHRHWATIFDLVTKKPDPEEDGVQIDFQCRFEWLFDKFTIATDGGDVFFTAHNKTHYVVYSCIRGRGPERRTEPVKEVVQVWDIRKTATQRAPRHDRDLHTRDYVRGAHRRTSEGGNPQFLGLFISRDTVDPQNDDLMVGYVFFHLEHRTVTGLYHQVSSVGLPLGTIPYAWHSRCARPCNYSHHGEVVGAHDSGASDPDWPGRPPHWRHQFGALANTLETARMLSRSAGLAVIVRFKKSTSIGDQVSAEHAFGVSYQESYRGRELVNSKFGNDKLHRSKISGRWNDEGGYIRALCGRFVIFGDETMLVGENPMGDIQVLIL
ncbi:hypothetical protein F5X68DRAFT_230644 [Plectosphaerella plurivora]|uniref:F-box domain-containing protein n=1 Tax=Plectosphaerella plurivora TaxID=936078 RepID=A0A9P8VFS5_9PEZI|nr:hypothetical protein F5X68DRAFT_230644 [Plectosphaerella plurivora]